MQLMTKELRRKLPPFGTIEAQGPNTLALVHYFTYTPDGDWDWYIFEFDGSNVLFGLVDDGFELKFGYFSFSKLEEVRSSSGFPVMRDSQWKPVSLGQLVAAFSTRGV